MDERLGLETILGFFEDYFIKNLFDNDANFKLALSDEVVEIFVHKESFRIAEKRLFEIGHYYEMKSWSRVV